MNSDKVKVFDDSYVTITVYKKVEHDDGHGWKGYKMVATGEMEDCYFTVYLDRARVHRLAQKAATNKTGKSKLGPIDVLITDRKRWAVPKAK